MVVQIGTSHKLRRKTAYNLLRLEEAMLTNEYNSLVKPKDRIPHDMPAPKARVWISSMVHEMRNPETQIQWAEANVLTALHPLENEGFLVWLHRNYLSEKAKHLTDVVGNVAAATASIDDFESKKQKPTAAMFDVDQGLIEGFDKNALEVVKRLEDIPTALLEKWVQEIHEMDEAHREEWQNTDTPEEDTE